MTSGIVQQSFSINLRVLSALHLYPPENCTRAYKIPAYLIHLLCVTLVPVLSILNLLLEDNLDMERVNYNAAYIIQATCYIVKFLPFVTKGQRIRKCIDYFDKHPTSQHNYSQRLILDACIRICQRNSKIFLIGAGGAVSCWALRPMFWENRYFPVDIWLPFNAEKILYIYCIVYLLITAATFISGLVAGAVDPLVAGLVYHATSQIKILNNNLENLYTYAKEDFFRIKTDKTKHDFVYERIVRSIKHHDDILKFVKEYEACFSWVIFSQISTSVFVLCFVCLQISKVKTLDFNLLQLATYITFTLGQIYFYCYYASTLSEESDSMSNAIYMNKWYNYNTKCKQALKLLMAGSEKPLIITTGKIVDLSLITFTTILQRSYSLLAVLKNY